MVALTSRRLFRRLETIGKTLIREAPPAKDAVSQDVEKLSDCLYRKTQDVEKLYASHRREHWWAYNVYDKFARIREAKTTRQTFSSIIGFKPGYFSLIGLTRHLVVLTGISSSTGQLSDISINNPQLVADCMDEEKAEQRRRDHQHLLSCRHAERQFARFRTLVEYLEDKRREAQPDDFVDVLINLKARLKKGFLWKQKFQGLFDDMQMLQLFLSGAHFASPSAEHLEQYDALATAFDKVYFETQGYILYFYATAVRSRAICQCHEDASTEQLVLNMVEELQAHEKHRYIAYACHQDMIIWVENFREPQWCKKSKRWKGTSCSL